ncbi:MAG: hypothetical protein LBG69_09070 [Zoogloeaceae bacterium]|jgi:hypothetical protein|nr:hypothetical protein [Zoogloeaceae bacterium]
MALRETRAGALTGQKTELTGAGLCRAAYQGSGVGIAFGRGEDLTLKQNFSIL